MRFLIDQFLVEFLVHRDPYWSTSGRTLSKFGTLHALIEAQSFVMGEGFRVVLVMLYAVHQTCCVVGNYLVELMLAGAFVGVESILS